MATYEELKIVVKVPDEQETKKALASIKDGFSNLVSGEHAEGIRALGRQIGDIERVIKALTASAESGDAFKAIGSITQIFGKTGAIGLGITAIAELVNATVQLANSQARGLAALADQARRIGIHPAQLQAEVEQVRKAQISEEKWFGIVQHLHEKMVEIGVKKNPEARNALLKMSQDPEAGRLKMDILNRMIIAPQAEQLNILLQGARDVINLYAKRGFKEEGQLEAEDFVRAMTGSVDLLRVEDKFAQVSEEDKQLMDKMVASSQAWINLMAGMANNFESIIRLIGVNIMNDPTFGAIMRVVAAGLQAERETREEEMLGKTQPALPDWMKNLPLPGLPFLGLSAGEHSARAILRMIQILRRGQAQEGATQPQRLLGSAIDKHLDENQELIAQFRRLNALLSGEEKPIQRLPIHNQPMGGATGESNPLGLASGVVQPGGGATSEAVPLLRPWQPGDPSRGTYGKGKQYPILSAAATPLTPLPSDPTYSGVGGGRGVASYFGYHPTWGVDPNDLRGSSALRVPERYQGISLSTGTSGALGTSGQTLGQWANVTDPRTGLTSVRQQTDVGPGVRTQKLVDIGAESAIQMGYPTRKAFEAMQERVEKGELQPWQVRQAGFGTYGRPGLEGRDITAPMVKGVEPTTTTQNIRELDTGKLIDPRLVGGQRGTTPGGVDIEYGGGSGAFDVGGFYDGGRSRGELGESPTPSLLQGQQRGPAARPLTMLAADESDESVRRGVRSSMRAVGLFDMEERGRRDLDRGLANEDNIDASGDLNVNVKAPAGTEVKATGGGIFDGNVSLQRQMELPQVM
jgi:hypothetical protein